MLPALADLGYHTLAVSLRGHGGSQGSIRGASIKDYVSDVVSVVDELDDLPVVVGHSMGGYTTQHYLAAGNQARAAVLVSPVPASGAWGATLKTIRKHPGKFLKANITLDVGAVVESPDSAYDLLVSDRLSRDFIVPYMERLERASYRTYMDMLFSLPRPDKTSVPMLIVGGADDDFFSENEWIKTAEVWRAELRILDGIGHQPMWEGEGRALVAAIDEFVAGLPSA